MTNETANTVLSGPLSVPQEITNFPASADGIAAVSAQAEAVPDNEAAMSSESAAAAPDHSAAPGPQPANEISGSTATASAAAAAPAPCQTTAG